MERLTGTLQREHDISRTVSLQVLRWFGELNAGMWKMNVDEVLSELGLGILRNHKQNDPIERQVFMDKWREAVGDTFADRVELGLIAGNYLERSSGITEKDTLSYFPASDLPTEPAARFSDLFLTRPRWKVEEISPFLSEIAVDSKERDKLLLKYCRAVNEAGVVWYTARAQYNG